MQKKFCQNINDVMQITDVMRISYIKKKSQFRISCQKNI
jgi:hypothetical protein